MKVHILVHIFILSLLYTACTSSTYSPPSPSSIDPTTNACHIDPHACATLTPAPELSPTPAPPITPAPGLSPTATLPTLPGPVIHDLPGPIYETVIQIPVGEDGILYRGAGVEDMEPVGPNGLVVTPYGVFIIGDIYGNRLLRYDSMGNRLDDIDLTTLGILNISDLVGAGDSLYILEISFKVLPERYRVNQLTADGELVRQYDLPKGFHLEDGLYSLAIGFTSEGEPQVLVQLGAAADSRYYRVPGSAQEPPEALPALPVYGKSLYREDADPGEMASLAIDDQEFESQMTAGGTISLLSARADGSLYLQREDLVSWNPVITTDLTIHYISPQGEPLGVARYPLMDWYFHLWRYLTVGPDGNAYALITREKSVDVLRLNFYPDLEPIQSGAAEPVIMNSSNLSSSQPLLDCSQVEHMVPGSLEAQNIVQQFIDNFHHDWPTEYMEFDQVWTVDRLGEYAVIQGRVTDEENDIIVAQRTERGFTMISRHTSHDWLPSFRTTDVVEAIAAELPGVPSKLFYCLDLSDFSGK